MITRMARFEKVSFDQYKKDVIDTLKMVDPDVVLPDNDILAVYNNITVPTRATTGSAGYDFVSPCWFQIAPGQTVLVPTGIKVYIEPGWFLALYPRSGHGFKYRLQLDNTVGIIDCDYYNTSKNEGHIIVKATNDSNIEGNVLTVEPGDRFIQGIFQPYGITYDDVADGTRNGGMGSTNEQKR